MSAEAETRSYFDYLLRANFSRKRGSGMTSALVMAAKSTGGVVVCATDQQARLLNKQFTTSVGLSFTKLSDLMGRQRNVYLDSTALELLGKELEYLDLTQERRTSEQKDEISSLERRLEAVTEEHSRVELCSNGLRKTIERERDRSKTLQAANDEQARRIKMLEESILINRGDPPKTLLGMLIEAVSTPEENLQAANAANADLERRHANQVSTIKDLQARLDARCKKLAQLKGVTRETQGLLKIKCEQSNGQAALINGLQKTLRETKGLKTDEILRLLGDVPASTVDKSLDQTLETLSESLVRIEARLKHLRNTEGGGWASRKTRMKVQSEITRARRKFPANSHLMTALSEEVGELAEACLKYGSKSDQAYDEASQVACVALRIMEEGDSTLYEPPEPQDAKEGGEPS